ncbi:MAG: DUF4304 domain-containing protein [Cyclobacteriaceae bacterium]|nr:DUF4304 domain-containing protein [Cyclobacteriaceae bacterium]
MDSKEFKTIFGEVANANTFKKAFGGWYKESPECIVVLELQKSSFADSYYLNIKIFIQGAFERTYTPSKDLIKSSMGHVTNQIRDKDILNFDEPMDDDKRKQKLEILFTEFIMPFTDKALSRQGLKELGHQEKISLLPAVKQQLEV